MTPLIGSWSIDGEVASLAISADGGRVAAGINWKVYTWDLSTGEKLLGPLSAYGEMVTSVAFSPDGRILVSGLDMGKMMIWDSKTGDLIYKFVRKQYIRWPPVPMGYIDLENGHTGSVHSLVFSQDGQLLVSGSLDHSIGLWDTRSWKPADEPIDTGSRMVSLALSPDDKKIVCLSERGIIKLYDIATRTLIFEVTAHKDYACSVAFSPNGRLIASAARDSIIRIWDGLTCSSISTPLQGHMGPVLSVAFSPDGRCIASGSDDQTIRIWDTDTGTMQGDPLHGHTGGIKATVFTPDGTRLISASNDKSIKIWDIRGLIIHKTPLKELELESEPDPLDITITSTTTPAQVISHLSVRGCSDMTDAIDMATCSEYPVSSGGFGDIYKCKLKSGTDLAIKTIRLYVGPDNQVNQKALKYTAREMYAWSKCRHPNVQPLLGLVMFRNQIGMVTVWEPNGSLPQYLEQHTDIDGCILVHGDLKGANVLISKGGVAQLADFGNASLQESTLQFTKTSSRETLSLRWAAPELLEGARCSFAADVYALGMTILETISGKVPWSGQSERAVILAVMLNKTNPERPETHIPTYSEQGDTLWSLLVRCWETEPEKRPNAAQVKFTMKSITREGLKSREIDMDDADSS